MNKIMRLKVLILLMFCFTTSFAQIAKDALASENNRNKPELEEWLKDAGFGLMMHWSVDSQLGTVLVIQLLEVPKITKKDITKSSLKHLILINSMQLI
jgi:hypothetical protein